MMALGITNLVESATRTGGSWLAGLPVTNIGTRDMAEVARSTDAIASSSVIELNHGSAKTARALCIVGHNLTSAATITWDRGTTAGGNDVQDGSAINAWQIAPLEYSGRQFAAWVVVTATSARYDKIVITDTANPAGYIEIAYVWMSDLWSTFYGPVVGLQHGVQDFSGSERSDAGALWINRRRRVRNVSMTLEGATPTEAAILHNLSVYCATTEPVLYCADVADAAERQRYGFVGSMSELNAIEWPYNRMGRLPVRIVEL